VTLMIEFEPGTQLPPPSPSCLADFQAYARISLPAPYVTMLRTTNGGVPVRKVFDEGGRPRVIERFLPLLDDPSAHGQLGFYDLEHTAGVLGSRLCELRNEPGLRVIPIAALFAGDYLCLDFRHDPERPVLAVWHHEESTDFKPSLTTVAPSFEALVAMLRE
jgi:hypothetical protein